MTLIENYRALHSEGSVRVVTDDHYVLSGGSDGVLTMLSTRHKWMKAAPLWSRECHANSAITALALHIPLQLAFSSARDGLVILHENILNVPDYFSANIPNESDNSSSLTELNKPEELQKGNLFTFNQNKQTIPISKLNLSSNNSNSTCTGPSSRVICRLTGEVRCLCFDCVHQRLFIGGDSLRCLHMNSEKFHITTVPLFISHPLSSLVLSPCRKWMAMANTEGSLAVCCVAPCMYESSSSQAVHHSSTPSNSEDNKQILVEKYKQTRFIFHNVFSPHIKRDDMTHYQMSWSACPLQKISKLENNTNISLLTTPDKEELLLFVPTAAEVQIYKLENTLRVYEQSSSSSSSSPTSLFLDKFMSINTESNPHNENCNSSSSNNDSKTGVTGVITGKVQMKVVGGLHQTGFAHYTSALTYLLSRQRIACLLMTNTSLAVMKVDLKTLAATFIREHTFYYNGDHLNLPTDGTITSSSSVINKALCQITDVSVNTHNGDVLLGVMPYVTDVHEATSSASNVHAGVVLLHRFTPKGLSVMSSSLEGNKVNKEEKEINDKDKVSYDTYDMNSESSNSRSVPITQSKNTTSNENNEVSKINNKSNKKKSKELEEYEEEEEEEEESEESSSSSTSSDDDDEDKPLVIKEDLNKVVRDLKRNNVYYNEADNEVDRPSRWRTEKPEKVLRETESKLERDARYRSRYLDDEAEEISSSDVEAENEEAYDDHEEEEVINEVSSLVGSVDMDSNNNDDNQTSHGERGNGNRRRNRNNSNKYDSSTLNQLSSTATRLLTDYSFQVGATPLGAEETCYLAYNATGFIHRTRDGVTIYFHDMQYPAIKIGEKGMALMATLSPTGAGFVFAQTTWTSSTNGTEEVINGNNNNFGESVDDTPRLEIYYKLFNSIAAQSEWRLKLFAGETVRCLASGLHFISVATSRYLRIFSISGLELFVLSLYPRIITMTGITSRRLAHHDGFVATESDPLAIAYLPSECSHTVHVAVLDIHHKSMIIPSHVVPLTENEDGTTHQLQWLGFSEDGPLHCVDTAGVVRVYAAGTFHGTWIPLYDPRSSLSSLDAQLYYYWIWNVCDEYLFAYKVHRGVFTSEMMNNSNKNEEESTITTKIANCYPVAVATGLPTEHVLFHLPLTRISGMNDRQWMSWDHLLRRQVKSDELKHQSSFYNTTLAKFDALHDNKLIEFFNSALQEQLSNRAFDLAELLELRDNIELCARSANKAGHAQLVQKLLKLYEGRVKNKRKRKCTLPLEGSTMSEKERDALLRRLMLKEKQTTNNISTCSNENEMNRGNVNSVSPKLNSNDKISKYSESKAQEVEIVDAREHTPNKTNSTNTENNISNMNRKAAESNVTPPSALRTSRSINSNLNNGSSSAKRRVSFDLPDANKDQINKNNINDANSQSSTLSSSSSSSPSSSRFTSSSSLSFKPPVKPVNPFAKRQNVPCVNIDGPITTKDSYTLHDTPPKAHSTTTPPIAESTHSESKLNQNGVKSVSYDSTSVQSDSNTIVVSHNKENKDTLTEVNTITKIEQPSKFTEPIKKNKFIPQILPNSQIFTSNSSVTNIHNENSNSSNIYSNNTYNNNNDGLYEAQETDKCETISLDTVLASVNEDDDDNYYNNNIKGDKNLCNISKLDALSHSHVLGEALRKRYREDDDEDDN